mgnify:CR=1 FL=1
MVKRTDAKYHALKAHVLGALLSLVSLSAAAADGPQAPNTALNAIPVLDVPRYLGVWYEIAKYPNRFQRQCTGDTTAQYSANPDGSLQVVNRCRTASGEMT